MGGFDEPMAYALGEHMVAHGIDINYRCQIQDVRRDGAQLWLTCDKGDQPGPYELLSTALDEMVACGTLSPDRREGAEVACWSAVHGFALLALRGPLRSAPATVVNAAAQRTVDAVITGIVS
jgi:hypothetical protein